MQTRLMFFRQDNDDATVHAKDENMESGVEDFRLLIWLGIAKKSQTNGLVLVRLGRNVLLTDRLPITKSPE